MSLLTFSHYLLYIPRTCSLFSTFAGLILSSPGASPVFNDLITAFASAFYFLFLFCFVAIFKKVNLTLTRIFLLPWVQQSKLAFYLIFVFKLVFRLKLDYE